MIDTLEPVKLKRFKVKRVYVISKYNCKRKPINLFELTLCFVKKSNQ